MIYENGMKYRATVPMVTDIYATIYYTACDIYATIALHNIVLLQKVVCLCIYILPIIYKTSMTVQKLESCIYKLFSKDVLPTQHISNTMQSHTLFIFICLFDLTQFDTYFYYTSIKPKSML